MALQNYIQEHTADGFAYRLRGTERRFFVYPFCGVWRATNGLRSANGATAEQAAENYVGAL